MFDPTFDLVLMILFAVLGFIFMLGKGDGILKAFGTKPAVGSKKHSREYKQKYQHVIAVFMFILTGTELLLFLFSDSNKYVVIATIIVIVIALIGSMVYLTKKFPEGY